MTKAFLVYSKEVHKLSDVEHINTILKVIRAFFVYLMEEEYIHKNPVDKVKFIKEEQVIIKTFTDEEVLKLIKAYSNIDYLAVRNKTIIALQLDAGIRCTESLDIRFNDLLGDRILIHGKGDKQRLVGISPPMNRLLKQYKKSYDLFFDDKENKDENLFLSRTGRRLTVEMIERIYKKAQATAKITRAIRVSSHTSRHTFAVTMLQNNDIKVTKIKNTGFLYQFLVIDCIFF
jgi:integrase/recombinase XerD